MGDHFLLRALCVCLSLFLSVACSSTGENQDDSETNNMENMAQTAEQGVFLVDECTGLNGIDEPCRWFYQFDPEQCSPQKPCKKAVFFASGGDNECGKAFDDPDLVYLKIAAEYAAAGYFFACLDITRSNIQAGPSRHVFTERLDLMIKDIRNRNNTVLNGVWDGSYLMHSGISWGATYPVVSMARTEADNDPAWQGSEDTAACYFDGTYDPLAANTHYQLSSLATGGDCTLIRTFSICNPYMDGDFDCDDPSPSDPDIIADTIAGDVVPEDFAIKNWKLIECGSNLTVPTCRDGEDFDRDWTPSLPITQLCLDIGGGVDDGYVCETDPMPDTGHVSCSNSTEGIHKCLDWFDQIAQ